MLFSGGFGTLGELCEAPTLIQTGKIRHFPVVLAGSSHLSGLESWIRARLLEEGMVAPEDLALLTVADDPDEIADIIAAGAAKLIPTGPGLPDVTGAQRF
ncbi:MAG: LOG family protein [Mycobacterium sp.]